MSNDDTPTRQIDPPVLECLGRFVVHWSLLEGMVSDLFVAVVSSDVSHPVPWTQVCLMRRA